MATSSKWRHIFANHFLSSPFDEINTYLYGNWIWNRSRPKFEALTQNHIFTSFLFNCYFKENWEFILFTNKYGYAFRLHRHWKSPKLSKSSQNIVINALDDGNNSAVSRTRLFASVFKQKQTKKWKKIVRCFSLSLEKFAQKSLGEFERIS